MLPFGNIPLGSTFCISLINSSLYFAIVGLPCLILSNCSCHPISLVSGVNRQINSVVNHPFPPSHPFRLFRTSSHHLPAAPFRYTGATWNFRASSHLFALAMLIKSKSQSSASSSLLPWKSFGFAIVPWLTMLTNWFPPAAIIIFGITGGGGGGGG